MGLRALVPPPSPALNLVANRRRNEVLHFSELFRAVVYGALRARGQHQCSDCSTCRNSKEQQPMDGGTAPVHALVNDIAALSGAQIYGRVQGVRGLLVEVGGPVQAMSIVAAAISRRARSDGRI